MVGEPPGGGSRPAVQALVVPHRLFRRPVPRSIGGFGRLPRRTQVRIRRVGMFSPATGTRATARPAVPSAGRGMGETPGPFPTSDQSDRRPVGGGVHDPR